MSQRAALRKIIYEMQILVFLDQKVKCQSAKMKIGLQYYLG